MPAERSINQITDLIDGAVDNNNDIGLDAMRWAPNQPDPPEIKVVNGEPRLSGRALIDLIHRLYGIDEEALGTRTQFAGDVHIDYRPWRSQ